MKRLFIATVLALSLNNVHAGLNEGVDAYENSHYATALKELEPLANEGDATAQYYVGLMYDNGFGVEQDYSQSFAWYLKSALQNDTDAQYNLAYMYANAQGTPQDLDKALEWYQKSANGGDDGDAQFNLGHLYEYGMIQDVEDSQTIPIDYKKAVYWYRIAADKYKDSDAQLNLGFMYDRGYGIPQSYATALKYYKLSAAQDNAQAQYNIGYMYEHGEGVTKDKATAILWYEKAADNGLENATSAVENLKQ